MRLLMSALVKLRRIITDYVNDSLSLSLSLSLFLSPPVITVISTRHYYYDSPHRLTKINKETRAKEGGCKYRLFSSTPYFVPR